MYSWFFLSVVVVFHFDHARSCYFTCSSCRFSSLLPYSSHAGVTRKLLGLVHLVVIRFIANRELLNRDFKI